MASNHVESSMSDTISARNAVTDNAGEGLRRSVWRSDEDEKPVQGSENNDSLFADVFQARSRDASGNRITQTDRPRTGNRVYENAYESLLPQLSLTGDK